MPSIATVFGRQNKKHDEAHQMQQTDVPQIVNSPLQDSQVVVTHQGMPDEAVHEGTEKLDATGDSSSSKKSFSKDAAVIDISAKEKGKEVNLEDEENRVYPTGLKLAGIMFGLCCSIFVVALDQTISEFSR